MKAVTSLLLAALLATPAAAALSVNKKNLEQEIERIRRAFPGEMAVYMKNLSTGDEIALDADRVYETFSVIKVPIMIEVLRRVEKGELSLSDRTTLRASDARWPTGVLYALDPGLQPTLKDLVTLMIIISDNAATDILADKAGRANVTQTLQSLGLKKTTIEYSDLDYDRAWLGSLDPRFLHATAEQIMSFPFERYSDAQADEAFRRTIEARNVYFGHSTAREMGRLFEMMAKGELVSKQASQLMIAILKKQQVNDRFPRYLRDVPVAHKTGDGQPFIANDAGILWVKGQPPTPIGGQPIVLVVFTAHHRGETAALHDAIARVAAYVARNYGGQLSSDFREEK